MQPMTYVLQQLLAESAQRYSEKVAVWAHTGTLTYRQLEERSNQIAHFIRQRGIRKGDRLGLYAPKSADSIAAIFGILKAEGVYVPLDPQAPLERIHYIIADCGIRGLFTTADKWQNLESSYPGLVEFSVLPSGEVRSRSDVVHAGAVDQFPSGSAPASHPVTTDLAYILYTSGSTGRPKGVMLSHQNALTFIGWCAETFKIRSDDRLANHAPLHFDLSVFDIYNAIEAGATVCLVPEDVKLFPTSLASFMESQAITVWYSVPSALVYLVLHGNLKNRRLQQLRLLLFAGEVFAMKYLRQLTDLLPRAEFYNLFGPTETNVCTYYQVDRALLSAMERLPIGRACSNTEVFAVNDRGEVAKLGEVGELYVRGPSLTAGYWGDPEKTRKTLVSNRFQRPHEEKIYKTGDLVVLRADGNYDFVGRCDSMIKSRGYRIELGEIEAALLSHSAVREAVALPLADQEIGNRIKAVVVPDAAASLTPGELQSHCASRIPSYMIPEIIEFCEVLPKTSTGKIDRVRLAQSVRLIAADLSRSDASMLRDQL
jgi:amino acid adenylation domain-containing protein